MTCDTKSAKVWWSCIFCQTPSLIVVGMEIIPLIYGAKVYFFNIFNACNDTDHVPISSKKKKKHNQKNIKYVDGCAIIIKFKITCTVQVANRSTCK